MGENQWHTEEPTEKGLYVIKVRAGGYKLACFSGEDFIWVGAGTKILHTDPSGVICWQKIEPYIGK